MKPTEASHIVKTQGMFAKSKISFRVMGQTESTDLKEWVKVGYPNHTINSKYRF